MTDEVLRIDEEDRYSRFRLINLRYSCPLLKQEDLLAGKVPTAPTIASMIGGLQTQEALKLIHGMEVAAGSAMIFNGVANTFYTTRFQRKEDCLSHDTWPPPFELPLSAESTAEELLGAARERAAGDGPPAIALERDLVVSVDCAVCGASRRVMRPRQLVSIRETECHECGELARPTLVHAVEEASPLAKEKLCDLGIPPYDVVRVTSEEGEAVFLLAGDRDRVLD